MPRMFLYKSKSKDKKYTIAMEDEKKTDETQVRVKGL